MIKLLKVLLNPFLLSIVFSLIIIALLPPVFDKFVLELNIKAPLTQEQDFGYFDLDNDGIMEQCQITSNTKGFSSLFIRDSKGYTIDQWNLQTHYFPQPLFNNVYDLNYDGKKEMMIFTRRNDSIFLNAVDPLGTGEVIYQNVFITEINKYNGEDDIDIKESSFADLNNDGYFEILFPVNVGFSISPRKLFAYDYYNDSLFSTVDVGNRLSEIKAIDLNNDGKVELISSAWAPRNYKNIEFTGMFHDTSAFLMVFNNELEFFFPPVAENFSIGDMINDVIKKDGQYYILSQKRVSGKSHVKSLLQLFDINGNKLKQVFLPEVKIPFSGKYGIFIIENDEIIIPTASGEVFYYDFDFILLNKREMPVKNLLQPNLKSLDINNDGNKEFIGFDLESRMIIVDDKLKHPVFYDFNTQWPPKLSVIAIAPGTYELLAVSDKYIWYFTYKLNQMYYWQYPIYVIVFIVILLLNLAIRKMQNIQLEKKYAIKQQITELQLKTIKNQMEPHFMFNALNSIASAIYDEDKNVAYNYFTKVARLVRKTLDDSDKIVRTVEEEINFVKDYLDVEKIRFGDKIDYEINITKEVDRQFNIPKMLIQIYVENSIKHGIRHKPEGGVVVIKLFEANHYLTIEIEDNGVGRKKAQELGSKSTGKGKLIIQQYYSLFSEKSKHKIKQVTIDLKDDAGRVSGTKVVIKVPVNIH